MIDPKSVFIACPAGTGNIAAELAGALVAIGGRYHGVSFKSEMSDVALVRNICVDNFLRTDLDWFVGVDSDIYFSPQDYGYLMEEANTDHERSFEPEPSRIESEVITRDSNGQLVKASVLCDRLVIAEYSYKNDALEPVKMGMGFVRIHRSVFETLLTLKNEPDPELLALRTFLTEQAIQGGSDSGGITSNPAFDAHRRYVDSLIAQHSGLRLESVIYRGELITPFFVSGPLQGEVISSGHWKGEDHFFFSLCVMAGIIPRIERRTQLIHVGRKGYPYQRGFGGGQ